MDCSWSPSITSILAITITLYSLPTLERADRAGIWSAITISWGALAEPVDVWVGLYEGGFMEFSNGGAHIGYGIEYVDVPARSMIAKYIHADPSSLPPDTCLCRAEQSHTISHPSTKPYCDREQHRSSPCLTLRLSYRRSPLIGAFPGARQSD